MQTYSSCSQTIDGVETEVAIQNYVDRVLVLITQLGKIGHIIQASIPATVPLVPPSFAEDGLPLIESPPSIEQTSIFGTAPSTHLATLHSLYASQTATLIWTTTTETAEIGRRRDVVVGIALKKSQDSSDDDVAMTSGEKATFKGVIKMIIDILRDGDGQGREKDRD